MALRIYTGAGGSRFVAPDKRGFGDLVAQASVAADAPVTSGNRSGEAEPMLREIGKMSQPQLFRCSLNCTADCHGNCNPANPPGFSTHELRNDGPAWPALPRGARLRYWQQGLDVQRDRVAGFIREMARRKYIVTQTYPGSPSESQHVGFRREPRIDLWKVRPLRRGMTGRRVRTVIGHLRSIQEPGKREPYLTHKPSKYGPAVERAVKRFQRDHHLELDGQVGVRTYSLLKGTAARAPSRLDKAGIDFLVDHEGEVLYAYNDPAGHATFGVGHLLHKGPVTAADAAKYGVRENREDPGEMRQLSRKLLAEDVARFERAVIRHVPERWRGSHDRFNALVSLAFNLGEGVLTPEPPLTSLGKALGHKKGAKGRQAIADAIMLYRMAGDKPILEPRRRDERALFLRNR